MIINNIKQDGFFKVRLECPKMERLETAQIGRNYFVSSQNRTAVFYSRPQPRTKKEGKPHPKKECKSASATATCHNKKH
jgi:hypothetical protein